jgi:hypothetical protein
MKKLKVIKVLNLRLSVCQYTLLFQNITLLFYFQVSHVQQSLSGQETFIRPSLL